MAESHDTRRIDDHNTIRSWAEEGHARSTRVKQTGGGEYPGVLRLDFPGYDDDDPLEEISWDEFFQKFDEKGLDFIYQTARGEVSNFGKPVNR